MKATTFNALERRKYVSSKLTYIDDMEQTKEKIIEKKTAKTTKPSSKKVDSTSKKVTATKTKATSKKVVAKKTEEKATKKATTKVASTTVAKKPATKKTTTKSASTTVAKKTATKKATTKAASTTADKDASTKSTTKKAANKTASAAKKTSTKSTTKKATTKTATRRNVAASNVESTNNTAALESIQTIQPTEYYDLPYRYNETTIKILAQTPHSLFLYWDISDNDRKAFIDTYGENFLYETKPVLIVHNKTQNYTFEVEVDDFTNSWYLRTPTSNCVFDVELARKKINSENGYSFPTVDNKLHITSSNAIESPNDHVLLDSLRNPIMFKNVKTNNYEERIVKNNSNLISLYKDIDIDTEFIHNPSSNFGI